jgi:flagellin-like protein
MMKKSWKNRSAVSPVIATILMVAITVVLAAVLYVMVMGFGGPTNQAPTGSFAEKQKIGADTEKVSFGIITPEKAPTAFKIVIASGTNSATFTFPATDATGPMVAGTNTFTPAVTTITPTYTDLAANKIVNNGDYISFVFSGTGYAGSYTVSLIYIQTGDVVTSTTFTI